MRRAAVYWCGLGALLFTLSAHGYERSTHRELSEKAADSSILTKGENILKDLGLTSLRDPKQTFPNSNGDSRILLDLIKDGADFEDNIPRFLNHFYDPVKNRPLTLPVVGGVGKRSPDWALEDKTDYFKQVYSYRHANEYLYLALTTPDDTPNSGNADERNEYFGRLFQTLGQVIHHLQDMAQPQHVRNDAHPPVGSHASFYEKYTDRNMKQSVADTLPKPTPEPRNMDHG